MADVAPRAGRPEHPDIIGGGAIDEQMRKGVVIALERGGEEGGRVVVCRVSDGLPPRAVVPVGIPRICRAAVVRVEVQVRGQLIARTPRRRAPHAGRGVGERRGIAGVGRRAIAVQVPADGVQLREGRHGDQPVVVRVVIEPGSGGHGRGRRPVAHAVHRAHPEGIRRAIGQPRHRIRGGMRLPRGAVGNRRPGAKDPIPGLLLILVRGEGAAVVRSRRPAQGHLGMARLGRHAPRRPRHGRRRGGHGGGRRAGPMGVHGPHLEGIRGAIG